MWTTPAAQELLFSDEHRSGASMCSACSHSAALDAGPDEARRLIAFEIGADRPVTLTIEAASDSDGIILYDAETDFPLNVRELSLRR